MTTYNHNFGAKIRRLRESCELAPNELARRLAASSTMVRKIEAGELLPRREVVLRLADALLAHPAELLDLRDQSKAAADQAKRERLAQLAAQRIEEAPTDPRLALGWVINRARRLAGLSQAAVERGCKMSPGYLRLVERGELYPGDAWLRELGAVLSVELPELQRLRDHARAVNTGRIMRARELRAGLRALPV